LSPSGGRVGMKPTSDQDTETRFRRENGFRAFPRLAMQTPPGSAPKVRKTVGIDLGTTNSVIAVLDATASALITGQGEHGRKTCPSVVGYHPGEQRAVAGRPAVALRGGGPAPVSSVKRSMGLDRRFAVGPEALTPPEVSARVLRLLRDVLARTLNDPRYLLD